MENRSADGLTPSIDESLDDEAATLTPSALAGILQEQLGQKIAAHLVGLGDARQLGRYRKSNGPKPRPVIELRLREAYKLVGMITNAFDKRVARSWLLGTNSRLGDRAPVDVFCGAKSPEEFRPIRTAARKFVISESTVRDPLADIDAVHAARARPMAERLELALSWNLVASELRDGMTEQRRAAR
ncbi:MAG: hypothetical protein IPK93_10275 [Solirubrobacterales bacterium]|nr:hypothetical protein [Solirubrobacterales bacterium]